MAMASSRASRMQWGMLSVAFLLLFVTPAQVSGKTTKGRIVIGGALQFTGKFENYGSQALAVMEMWKDMMDADEDFPFDIHLNFTDDESTSDKSVEEVGKMMIPRTSESPDVVICPYASSFSTKVCDFLDDSNISVVCGIWGGASETIFAYPESGLGNNLRVQSMGVSGNYFTAGLEYAFEQLNSSETTSPPTAAFIWQQTDTFSKSVCERGMSKAIELGFNVTLASAVDPLDSGSIYETFIDTLGKVPFVDVYDVGTHALNPLVDTTELVDVLVSCGQYDTQTAILLGLIARRIRPAFSLMTHVTNKKLRDSVLPINVLDIFIPTQWSPALPGSDEVFGTSQEFYSAFEERVGEPPIYQAATAGGLLTMLTRALKHSADVHPCADGECELNATALRAAFRAPEVAKLTYSGMIDINEYGMNEHKPLTLVQTQLSEGGSFVMVPALPVSQIPDSWVPSDSTAFPRWPARSWAQLKTAFINSYCGSAGRYIDEFNALKVALDRGTNAFGNVGTFTYPQVNDLVECPRCPRGKSRPLELAECYACSAGTFAADLGQAECELCEVGSAMSQAGALQCDPCARGTVAGEKGLKVCQQCERGRFMAQEGQSECENCPVGTYQERVGQSQCDPCVDIGGAEMTTRFMGSTSGRDCICPEGAYLSGQRNGCLSCPEGMTCPAGRGHPLTKPGMWAHPDDDEDRDYNVYRCRSKLQCPGGSAGTCAVGRDPLSVGCADCLPGYVPDSRGHQCKKCEGVDFIPLIFSFIVTLMALAALAYYAAVDVMKTNMNTLVALAISGQLVVVIQWLTVFGELEMDWVEPFVSLLNVASLISFNFDSMHLGCFVQEQNATVMFLVRLLCFPFGALVLVTMMFLHAKINKRRLDPNQVMNSLGLIMVVLFLSLTLMAFTPFVCIDSPNGTRSMASNPSVICDGSADYVGLAVLAVIGLLLYSLTPLVVVAYVTLRYPAIVASGEGSLLMTRYRFLFQRFRVEHYFYAPIFLFRNFLMALVPVVCSNHPHLQIIALGSMFAFFGLLSAYLKPWRGKLPNIMEATFMGHFLMILLVAGLIVDTDSTRVVTDMQAILVFLVVTSIIPFLGMVAWLAYQRFTVSAHQYGMFLSHHKRGMAVGARLIKLELSRRTKKEIFLDSDALDDLDGILNIVRNGVEYLVVLLTTETLWRPWCAGEITTAHTNNVPTICVRSDGYVEPSDDELELEKLRDRWSPEDFAPMALQGVTFTAVREAYVALRDLEKIQWQRAGVLSGHTAITNSTVDDIVSWAQDGVRRGRRTECAELVPRVSDSSSASSSPLASRSPLSSISTLFESENKPHDAEIVIIANSEDGEAISGAQVLSRMLRTVTQRTTAGVFSSDDLSKQNQPKAFVVCLTDDCLHAEVFAQMLLTILSNFSQESSKKAQGGKDPPDPPPGARGGAPHTPYLMTTRSPDFQFPVKDVISSIQGGFVRDFGVGLEEIQTAFAPVLSSLALPFFPSARESLVVAEVRAIADRLGRATGAQLK